MKGNFWTKVEENKLVELYKGEMPIKEISQMLNRSAASIRNKAYKLDITNPKKFTEEEIEYIEENYKSYNLKDIAKKLGRKDNYQNICRKARQLGIQRTGKKKEIIKKRIPKFDTEEERNAYRSKVLTEYIEKNGHPRGMLGKTHSKEYREELSKRVVKDWENRTDEEIENIITKRNKTRIKNGTLNPHKFNSNPYSYAKGGKREDLEYQYFRSAWEANIARVLNYNKLGWEYEPKQFIFKGIYHKGISYTPDFYIPKYDKWIEVKGWMDSKSKIKLERFEKYYPKEFGNLILVDEANYKEIEERYKNNIPNWE